MNICRALEGRELAGKEGEEKAIGVCQTRKPEFMQLSEIYSFAQILHKFISEWYSQEREGLESDQVMSIFRLRLCRPIIEDSERVMIGM